MSSWYKRINGFFTKDVKELIDSNATKVKLAKVGRVLELVFDASNDEIWQQTKFNESILNILANNPANQGKGYGKITAGYS